MEAQDFLDRDPDLYVPYRWKTRTMCTVYSTCGEWPTAPRRCQPLCHLCELHNNTNYILTIISMLKNDLSWLSCNVSWLVLTTRHDFLDPAF